MFDLITVGDATLDQFNIVDEAQLECDERNKNCHICFSLGAKIQIKGYSEHIGGNAANVVVATHKLGLKTAIYTELGKDEVGDKIFYKLSRFGVDMRYIKQRKGMFSNHASVITYKDERTIFSYHVPKTYRLPRLLASKWLFLTSLGVGGETLYPEILRYVKKNNTRLAFSPGTNQVKAGFAKIKNLLKSTYFYVSNLEEAQELFGSPSDKKRGIKKQAQKLLEKIIKTGVRYAVITAGIKGSFGYDGLVHYGLGCYPSVVVEKTGAGDSFSSAVVSALFYGKSLDEALEWGTVEAASTVTIAGAQNGLLSKRQLMSILNKNPKFLPQKC